MLLFFGVAEAENNFAAVEIESGKALRLGSPARKDSSGFRSSLD